MPRDPLFDHLDRPAVSYFTMWDGLGRRAREFRTELLLLALLAAGFAALYHVRRNPIVAGVELYAIVMVLIAIRPARRAVTGVLRASSLRRRWDSAVRHCGFPHPIAVSHVRRVAGGQTFAIRVGRGIALEDVSQRHRRLAAALGVRELRVLPDAQCASRGTVVLLRSEPLADCAGRQWPGVRRRFSLWDAIPLGVDEHGREVAITLVERNVLLGGMPGAGKSAAVSMMLAVAANDPDVRVWLIDGKQVEFAEWEPCATGFAHDLAGSVRVLSELQGVMNARYAELRDRGLRKVERTSQLPLHAVFVDELALFTATKDKLTGEFVELIRDLVARGRAAGVIVVAATQKPEGSVVATSVRDLFAYRLALRCGTPEASDTVLGRGNASQGFSAALIPPGQPGVGFLLAEDGVPVRFRTFYLNDSDVRALAARARERRARVSVVG